MLVGDRVRLVTPDNERLDGTVATIAHLEEWGAHVEAPAAATGRFRATWEEMVWVGGMNCAPAKENGFTGEVCIHCGSLSMVSTGTCSVCANCGESGGCG